MTRAETNRGRFKTEDTHPVVRMDAFEPISQDEPPSLAEVKIHIPTKLTPAKPSHEEKPAEDMRLASADETGMAVSPYQATGAMVKIRCRHCWKKLAVHSELAGKMVRCTRCLQPVKVPLTVKTVVDSPKGARTILPEGVTKPPIYFTQTEKGTIKFNCVHCQRKMAVQEYAQGWQVRCPQCHQRVRVPDKSEELGGKSTASSAGAGRTATVPLPTPEATSPQRPQPVIRPRRQTMPAPDSMLNIAQELSSEPASQEALAEARSMAVAATATTVAVPVKKNTQPRRTLPNFKFPPLHLPVIQALRTLALLPLTLARSAGALAGTAAGKLPRSISLPRFSMPRFSSLSGTSMVVRLAAATAAVVGGLAWIALVAATGYELGWFVPVIGLLVGLAVMATNPDPSPRAGKEAFAITVLGILASKLVIILACTVPIQVRQAMTDPLMVRAVVMNEIMFRGDLPADLQNEVNAALQASPQAPVQALPWAASVRLSREVDQRMLNLSLQDKTHAMAGYIRRQPAKPLLDRAIEHTGAMAGLWMILALGVAFVMARGLKSKPY